MRGGSRIGAGRKPKALNEKLLNGNPGKREIITQIYSDEVRKIGEKPMADFIHMSPIDNEDIVPSAAEIYNEIVEWINASGCSGLVPKWLIEDYSIFRAAYLYCEYMSKKYGRAVNEEKNVSPYSKMTIDYHKQMTSVYSQICLIVSKNSEIKHKKENTFLTMMKNKGN